MLARTALALLLLLLPLSATSSAQDLDTALSTLVRISGTRGDTTVRGTGFVVGLDRDKATIVTAAHVIEGVQQLEVAFAVDRTESFPAVAVLGMDSGNPHGLAALQVRGALPAGVTILSFEVESRPKIGDALLLLGFPQMAPVPRTAQRVLSARSGTMLLIDQGIGEGFSGGPILQGGKVVGVITDTDDQTTYAVNAVVAREALEGWGAAQVEPEPTAQACPRETVREHGIEYVRICPGTFTMGSAGNDPHAEEDEKPAHRVTLSEFWIGKTEITNQQFRLYQRDHQGADELPATHVTWAEAQAACAHFGGRLPTEAEWEYAARAGSPDAWSFGNDEAKLGDYAWSEKNADGPSPVATRAPNGWGLHDLHGNTWEWVADWYAPYEKGPQTDPTGPRTGRLRGVRGGSFADPAGSLRSVNRGSFRPEDRIRDFGFRCVRDAQTEPEPPAVQACPRETSREYGIDFVRICPGNFTMGSAGNDPYAEEDEKPARRVTLSEFWIGKTEITNQQFRLYQKDHEGADEFPATHVTWDEAQAACAHFGGRLPTEAEWEYAARAGSSDPWPFGTDETKLGDYAWYEKNSGGALHPVATRAPSDWGLHDMQGNVSEWVADWYAPYERESQTDPTGPPTGELRVARGGSFGVAAGALRSAFRGWGRPESRFGFIGFRCARDARRQP